MIATIILGVVAAFSAFLSRFKTFKDGLKFSFLLIFLFLALRFNFGNDYDGYLNKFLEINRFEQGHYFDSYYKFEPGWIFICRIFRPFGFFTLIATLALFNCLVYYRFIKKYIPSEYYWLAVFIYIFNPGFMLINASAMRQAIAIAIFVLSIDFIYEKKIFRYLLLIALASLFHTSVLILLPIYLVNFFTYRINITSAILILLLFVLSYVIINSLVPYINNFINIYFERYSQQLTPGSLNTGFGIIYLVILLGLTLFYEKYQEPETDLLFKIYIISFIFYPLGIIYNLIARIGMYFGVVSMVVYPSILVYQRKSIYRTIFIILICFMTIYSFIQFYNSDIWKGAFKTYQTIFSSPQIY